MSQRPWKTSGVVVALLGALVSGCGEPRPPLSAETLHVTWLGEVEHEMAHFTWEAGWYPVARGAGGDDIALRYAVRNTSRTAFTYRTSWGDCDDEPHLRRTVETADGWVRAGATWGMCGTFDGTRRVAAGEEFELFVPCPREQRPTRFIVPITAEDDFETQHELVLDWTP